MEYLIQPIINGILLGGLYAMVAVGMSMMFGIVRIVNLAHGDLMILASYLGMALVVWLGINPFLSILIVVPILFIIGFLIQNLMIKRVLGKDMEPPLLIAFGISIIVQNLLLMIFSPDAKIIVTTFNIK